MAKAMKILRLAFVTALAMTAVTASAAQANLFEAETYGVNFTFEHTVQHQFTIAGLTVKCAHITFNNGGLSKAATSVNLNPIFTECKVQLGMVEGAATVTGFGDKGEKDFCLFEVDAHGTLDLSCSGKAEVVVHTSACTVHIPPQKDIESLTYQNEGFGNTRDVKATFGLSKIKFTLTKEPNPFACEIVTDGPYGQLREDASYSGVSTVSGEEGTSPFKPIGIFVNFTK